MIDSPSNGLRSGMMRLSGSSLPSDQLMPWINFPPRNGPLVDFLPAKGLIVLLTAWDVHVEISGSSGFH